MLVALIEKGLREAQAQASRPNLYIVRSESDIPEPPPVDVTTWQEMMNEVNHLAESYRLRYLVARATAKVGKL